MTDEQGANEIKYRVASLLLLSLLDRSLISVWLLGEICGIEKAAHEKRQSNVKLYFLSERILVERDTVH